jgi:2-polyprenyl-3-methyl-5-hydroxy-6-metoxy-1,4-benzoquinol methylase
MKDTCNSSQNGPSKEDWAKLYENSSTNYEWLAPVLEHAGHKVLEIGCGSGLLSKRLLELGYDAYTNDYNGAKSERHRVFDVLKKWDNSKYDTIFSCGLLEHFNNEDIIKILKESAKHAKIIISMVPNSGSKGYRDWRKSLEDTGKWVYGDERYFTTLKKYYKDAGIDVIKEGYCGNDFGDGRYLLYTVGKTVELDK